MAMQIYDYGLDALQDWTTATFQWRLFEILSFSRGAANVTDALGVHTEINATNYAALAVQNPTRVVNTASNRIEYHADNPEWEALGPDSTINAVLLTKFVTNDNDSVPVGLWAISPGVASDVADPLIFDLASGMVAYVTQGT